MGYDLMCFIMNRISSYRDIVDAAHLRPITKQDKANAKTRNRLWNSAAPETSN